MSYSAYIMSVTTRSVDIKSQIKWHIECVRCLKDDNNVNIDNSKSGLVKGNTVTSWMNGLKGQITFELNLLQKSTVSLELFSLSGKTIESLHFGKLTQGRHQVNWNGIGNNGKAISHSVYLYKLNIGTSNITGQFTYIKQ